MIIESHSHIPCPAKQSIGYQISCHVPQNHSQKVGNRPLSNDSGCYFIPISHRARNSKPLLQRSRCSSHDPCQLSGPVISWAPHVSYKCFCFRHQAISMKCNLLEDPLAWIDKNLSQQLQLSCTDHFGKRFLTSYMPHLFVAHS